MPFSLLIPHPPEDCAESSCDVPVAFPVVASGSNAYAKTDVDINVFHCVHGHSNELLRREAATCLGVELVGKLQPCTGCSIAKDCRKSISNSTNHARQESWEEFLFT